MSLPAVRGEGGVAFLRELEERGMLTQTSLVLTDPDMPYEQYELLAALFGSIHRSSAFWIGDLLNFGEKIYGETYVQVADATGLSSSTCINYASVCHRVPSTRRRPELSFSSHEAVAKLEPGEQQQWLDAAVEKGWGREDLRHAMRAGETIPHAVERFEVDIDGYARMPIASLCPRCRALTDGPS